MPPESLNRKKVICSKHFSPDSFVDYVRQNRLKKTAIPEKYTEAVDDLQWDSESEDDIFEVKYLYKI